MAVTTPGAPPMRREPAYWFYRRSDYQPYLKEAAHHRSRSSRAQPDYEAAVPGTRRLAPRTEPETIEEIIARGYFAVPAGDPVTALLTDRGHTSWLGLDDVIAQIRGRYETWRQNVYDIEQAKLAAINAMHDWESYSGPATMEMRATLHNTLQRLYQQERDERTSLWRDISRLRQALPEHAQQYLSAHRKLSVLEYPMGDDR